MRKSKFRINYTGNCISYFKFHSSFCLFYYVLFFYIYIIKIFEPSTNLYIIKIRTFHYKIHIKKIFSPFVLVSILYCIARIMCDMCKLRVYILQSVVVWMQQCIWAGSVLSVQPGWHGNPVRGADCFSADGQPRATVLGPDQQYTVAPVQLQRDPQPTGGAGYHMRTVHSSAVGDVTTGGRHAGVVPPVRHDHQTRGGTAV